MQKKDVEVRCPECGGLILVDVATGTVLRHRKPRKDGQKEKKSALFDEVAEGVAQRSKNVPNAFESAFSTVKKRQSGLDNLFHDAVKKVEKDEEEKKRLQGEGGGEREPEEEDEFREEG